MYDVILCLSMTEVGALQLGRCRHQASLPPYLSPSPAGRRSCPGAPAVAVLLQEEKIDGTYRRVWRAPGQCIFIVKGIGKKKMSVT